MTDDLPEDELQRILERRFDQMQPSQLDQLARQALGDDELAWIEYRRDWRRVRHDLLRELRRQRLQEAAEAREAIKPP